MVSKRLITKLLSFSNTGLQIDTSTEIDFISISNVEIKSLFKDTMNNGLYGLCFSPYLEGQNIGGQLSEEQISYRVSIINPYTKWVRSFFCTDGKSLFQNSTQ